MLLLLILFTGFNIYLLVSRFRKSGGPAGKGSAEFIIRLSLFFVILLGLAGIGLLAMAAGGH